MDLSMAIEVPEIIWIPDKSLWPETWSRVIINDPEFGKMMMSLCPISRSSFWLSSSIISLWCYPVESLLLSQMDVSRRRDRENGWNNNKLKRALLFPPNWMDMIARLNFMAVGFDFAPTGIYMQPVYMIHQAIVQRIRIPLDCHIRTQQLFLFPSSCHSVSDDHDSGFTTVRHMTIVRHDSWIGIWDIGKFRQTLIGPLNAMDFMTWVFESRWGYSLCDRNLSRKKCLISIGFSLISHVRII